MNKKVVIFIVLVIIAVFLLVTLKPKKESNDKYVYNEERALKSKVTVETGIKNKTVDIEFIGWDLLEKYFENYDDCERCSEVIAKYFFDNGVKGKTWTVSDISTSNDTLYFYLTSGTTLYSISINEDATTITKIK